MKHSVSLVVLLFMFICYADSDSLPNKTITPGGVLKSATLKKICTPNYSKTVKNVPESMKKRVFKAYGITNPAKGEYEIDHLVPLCIGGSNEFKNLWPQHYDKGTWNAHKKDRLEVRMKRLICTGHLDLKQAQKEMASNWIAAYKKYVIEKQRRDEDDPIDEND